ncbi:MAG: hypothetical protein J6X84_07260 [Treponema sp.]|nr:hypothetical protein [Treponema sp.]
MKYYRFVCVLLFNAFCLFSGCSFFTNESDEETLTFLLPEWPPQQFVNSVDFPPAPATFPAPTPYPPLSRWLITVASSQKITEFSIQAVYGAANSAATPVCSTASNYSADSNYSAEPAANNSLQITVPKNQPFCVLATPVTFLKSGRECQYFFPAGYVFSANTKADFAQKEFSQNELAQTELSAKALAQADCLQNDLFLQNPQFLSWNSGYAAFIMKQLFYYCEQNNLSQKESATLAATFNWQKAISFMEQKINESVSSKLDFYDSSHVFYNPWLCDSSLIIKNIVEHSFKQSLFVPSLCVSFSTDFIKEYTGLSVFSRFIPENQIILTSKSISIRKETPILLSDLKEFGTIITFKSAKNVLIGYINM